MRRPERSAVPTAVRRGFFEQISSTRKAFRGRSHLPCDCLGPDGVLRGQDRAQVRYEGIQR
jgi:hypothetical protein